MLYLLHTLCFIFQIDSINIDLHVNTTVQRINVFETYRCTLQADVPWTSWQPWIALTTKVKQQTSGEGGK